MPPDDEMLVNPGDVFEVDDDRGAQLIRKAVFAPADDKAKVTVKPATAKKADDTDKEKADG